jgi:hypothetical protein
MFLHFLLFSAKLRISFFFFLLPTFEMSSQLFLIVEFILIDLKNSFPDRFLFFLFNLLLCKFGWFHTKLFKCFLKFLFLVILFFGVFLFLLFLLLFFYVLLFIDISSLFLFIFFRVVILIGIIIIKYKHILVFMFRIRIFFFFLLLVHLQIFCKLLLLFLL